MAGDGSGTDETRGAPENAQPKFSDGQPVSNWTKPPGMAFVETALLAIVSENTPEWEPLIEE